MSNLSRLITEVNEIEMALLEIDAIKEAVVIVREDIPGDENLVAYVVPHQKPAPTNSELRHYLQDKLPNNILPSFFVFLDALPLTSNGKVNCLALPAPDGSQQEMKAFVAPRNDQERQIAQIWEELLGIQPIGVRDNFFDLEGDSLLAVDLFAQIEKKFGKKFPIATLFQAGTVEALAQIIGQGEDLASEQAFVDTSLATLTQDKSKASWSSLVEIHALGSKPPLFCIHALGGGVLGYRDLALHLGAEQPVYGLQPQGLDGKQPPRTQVEDMASHYIQEIQTFQRKGPYFLAGYSFGGVVAFEMAQQLHRQGEKVGILVMIDTVRPGCYERSPFLMRVFLHLNNLLQLGPTYLWQKAKGWNEWINYYLKQRYKRYADIAQHALSITRNLPKNNEHLQVIDANVQALEKYVFQVYPGKMTLLRTEDKNRDESVGGKYDLYFGWRDFIAGELELHYIPGSHLSVLKEPHIQVLAEKLRVCLEKAYAINSTQ